MCFYSRELLKKFVLEPQEPTEIETPEKDEGDDK
jgi:hypothetical protein